MRRVALLVENGVEVAQVVFIEFRPFCGTRFVRGASDS